MVPLRVRSCYSLLRGTATPAELCRRAKRFGYRRLALTDIDNLYGLWAFMAACEREGLAPLVGAEIALGADQHRSVLLVRNDTGYRNLCRLITRVKRGETAAVEADSAHRFVGLIVLTGCASVLCQGVELGLSVAADLGSRPTERGSRLRRQAKACGVPAVATPDSDLAAPDEQRTFRLLRAIDRGEILAGHDPAPVDRALPRGLEPPDAYRRRFAIWPEAIRASEEIAALCTFSGPAFGRLMPPWRRDGAGAADQVLREQAVRGARRRYGDPLPDRVAARLDHELAVIAGMGFSSYFLVVRDIVQPCNDDGTRLQRRICGRGSGAASLVAFCLGITNVCPVRHNLYFERFLNPGRRDPPDIDIDFAWDERDQILAEVLNRFGERAAMVCNHVCFKPRMAIRETAKAFGLPGYEISRLSKRLPWLFKRGDMSLAEQIARLPALQEQDFSGPWAAIIAAAEPLIGLPRYLSVHPGGVVITPDPVRDYVPVEAAPKGVPVIQWEKDGAEESGLVKIDLLGNRSLGVIRDAVAAVRRNGEDFSERGWRPEDDQLTRAAVSRGRTMGCFYIESPAMRLLQQKAGSGDFEQLVLQSSIIRPAANEFVREYVRRLHGGSWEPLHPALERVLDETFGLMVYQEDVSRVAVALAGFSHGEADGLRKVLAKKDRELRLSSYRDVFFRGCRDNGIDERTSGLIWDMMMSFDGYSFCKPHSASYAQVSFQAAYLKTHFPAEFMAAVIANQGGYYSTLSYVSEAKRMGLVVDPPDVRVSAYRWQGRERRLRVGLQAVRDLSRETAKRIVARRRERPFGHLTDFLARVRPAEDEARALIDSGAMDGLDHTDNRSALFWELAAAAATGDGSRTAPLFPDRPVAPPRLGRPDPLELLRREYRALGFLCRDHPVGLVREAAPGAVRGSELASLVGRRVTFIGLLVSGKLVSTKSGDVMEFLSFEDETALVETTFFPAVYRRYAHLLAVNRIYLLSGLVEEDYGAVTLTVERAARFDRRNGR